MEHRVYGNGRGEGIRGKKKKKPFPRRCHVEGVFRRDMWEGANMGWVVDVGG